MTVQFDFADLASWMNAMQAVASAAGARGIKSFDQVKLSGFTVLNGKVTVDATFAI